MCRVATNELPGPAATPQNACGLNRNSVRMRRQAAERFAALLDGKRSYRLRAARYHGGITRPFQAIKQNHPGLLTSRNTGAIECPRGDTLHTHTPSAGAVEGSHEPQTGPAALPTCCAVDCHQPASTRLPSE